MAILIREIRLFFFAQVPAPSHNEVLLVKDVMVKATI